MRLRKKYLLIAATVLSVAVLYYCFSPADSGWFPRCPTKMLTGLDCPSCGAQRAFHAALHGRFAEAIGYNFFLLIGLPYLLAAIIASAGSGRVATWTRTHLLSPTMLWIYLGLYIAWWIVRNILGI